MVTKKRIRKIRPEYMNAELESTGTSPVLKFNFRNKVGGKEEVKLEANIYELNQLAKVVRQALVGVREAEASNWNRTNRLIKDLFVEEPKK